MIQVPQLRLTTVWVILFAASSSVASAQTHVSDAEWTVEPGDHQGDAHWQTAGSVDCGGYSGVAATSHGVCRDPGHPAKPKFDRPGDRSRKDNPPLRYTMDNCRRSGAPFCVHRFAKPSVTDRYSAWFVGGGAAFFRGRPRESTEGTWGLDYSGLLGKANIWSRYTRGRSQGGEGAYRTDGEPKLVSRTSELLGIGH
ncbi:hypothetical protein K227x_24480 [Rubripirellula lacrimiformis]|uniref:Secreted protein n=1 Tax=Rubripirellula lacrimiformis TaxID=1930273 RepID=A0A517NAA3_9BACT|nr:hypothetical protein [Rubripirellula lacrimiformis]QDT04062.1 hypothetical protein K227x_24480 [Rubripirellula lacrimiformis]